MNSSLTPLPREERRRTAIFASQFGGKESETAGSRTLYAKTLAARIPEHGGVIVSDLAFLLAEFEEAANAVNCAIDVQERFAQHNRLHREEGTVEAKIAVHYGEIIFPDGKPSGAGVDTAADLISIVPPGKIYITREVVARVRMLLQLKFEVVPSVAFPASLQTKEVLSVVWEAVTGNLEASLKKLGEDGLQGTRGLSSKFGFKPSMRASPIVLILFFIFLVVLFKILKWL